MESVMKKIRLDPEALSVQSFITAGAQGLRGTVHGAGYELPAPVSDRECVGESGMCLGTRFDAVCDTSHCIFYTIGGLACDSLPACDTSTCVPLLDSVEFCDSVQVC
jgi:hypothetical protein